MLKSLCCVMGLFFAGFAFAAKPPVAVFAATLSSEPYAETIQALGVLRANEAVTLSATVTETVRAIHFDDGQRVKANDVLVEMTSREEHAFLAEAMSAVADAKRQLKRVQSLVDNQLANQSLLDQRQQSLDSAEANLLAMQSRLEDRLILAPFSGVVGLRNISVGALVKPGDVLTTLDDDSVMKLDISVPEPFISAISLGMQVKAKSIVDEKIFTGEIKSVDSRIDPTTRTVVARANIANPDHALKPGMMMAVRLQKPSVDTVFMPEESVVQIGHQKFVYVIETSGNTQTARKTIIETGDRVKGQVAIKSGVAAGDMVITDGTLKVQDGSVVKVTAKDGPSKSLSQLLGN